MRRGARPAGPGEITYSSYLALGDVLSAQHPESARLGVDAHDEMLFIVVHQTYELWFKLVLHELNRVQEAFGKTPVDGPALSQIVQGLQRIHQIFKLAVAQLDVLETMTPQDFLDFRGLLSTSSGFQSLQFRLIEVRLGLTAERRRLYEGKGVTSDMSAAERTAYEAAERAPSLLSQLEAWLLRTPFLSGEAYAFREAYRAAVRAMLRTERADAVAQERTDEADAIGRAARAFDAIFDPGKDAGWVLSPGAVEAALFITVYRDRPALHMGHALLAALMDIDEAMALWRHRHALMVERMIGLRSGTGGSSGHDYLARTAREHRVFSDLFRLSTYLIPRAALPKVPSEIERRMAFVYASEADASGR